MIKYKIIKNKLIFLNEKNRKKFGYNL